MESTCSSSNLDHFGLVAGMIDELGLVELIDTVVKQDHEQRNVSVGTKKQFPINSLVLRRNRQHGGYFSSFLAFMSSSAIAVEKSY